MQSLLPTAISPDRSGLVEELAATVADNGGNWLESSMAHLGDEFAGIVRVEVAEGKAYSLRAALASIDGLTVIASVASAAPPTARGAETVSLELLGSSCCRPVWSWRNSSLTWSRSPAT